LEVYNFEVLLNKKGSEAATSKPSPIRHNTCGCYVFIFMVLVQLESIKLIQQFC